MHTQRLDEAQLLLARLNDCWSFTGNKLSSEVERFLLPTGHPQLHSLLLTVSAYGCLTRAACDACEIGYTISDDWNWIFRNVGQAIMFDIPSTLTKFEHKQFSKLYGKAFAEGFGRGESPPPPPPVGPVYPQMYVC